MAPAAKVMAEALSQVQIHQPSPGLVANVTAERTEDPTEIRRLLVEQVTGMVRWRESVIYLGEQGVDTLVELGSGKVLTGLVRRINRDMSGVSIQGPVDIDSFLETL